MSAGFAAMSLAFGLVNAVYTIWLVVNMTNYKKVQRDDQKRFEGNEQRFKLLLQWMSTDIELHRRMKGDELLETNTANIEKP